MLSQTYFSSQFNCNSFHSVSSHYLTYQQGHLLVWCNAVHCGTCRFLPLETQISQPLFSVFSGHVAPIAKVLTFFYCTDSTVLRKDHLVTLMLAARCYQSLQRKGKLKRRENEGEMESRAKPECS